VSDEAVAANSPVLLRPVVMEWVEVEWEAYADGKWEAARAQYIEYMRQDGMDPSGFWFNQIFNYVSRAQVLGLGNPLARQAMMKALATMVDCCGSMMAAHGLPPAPGHSSGDLHEWDPEMLP
jgi:hypothetical protein